ncbi:hypothetical protein H0W26_00865 [Candidatus Dependentiae bacterium]|nr:hypothetical protein [Candidatus Dependentiae bacterium]
MKLGSKVLNVLATIGLLIRVSGIYGMEKIEVDGFKQERKATVLEVGPSNPSKIKAF